MPRKGRSAIVGKWVRYEQEKRDEELGELARELHAEFFRARTRGVPAGPPHLRVIAGPPSAGGQVAPSANN
ncbi:hypothetical protein [Micromonospora sp. NPDC004704]